jgi:hypothetical protein
MQREENLYVVELVIMQYIETETLFIINFLACAILLCLGMLAAYRLFKSLEKDYASYYKSIGGPLINGPIKNFSYDDIDIIYIRLLKGGVFCYSMVFRGIPIDFPKSMKLRKLAKATRIIFTVLIILFVTLIISSYAFYKSSL